MLSTPIGIDLGTTFSAVAILDETGDVKLLPNAEGKYLTPSVLYFENRDNVVVGEVAKDARAEEPERVAEFVKRSMGTNRSFTCDNDIFSPIELSSFILRKLKSDAETALSHPVTEAVITCPAYFEADRRDATEKAARLAGLNVLALVNEPTAAALAFGADRTKSGNLLIFDLGGGTFDVTVLRIDETGNIRVLLSNGDAELGGKDFDDAISVMVMQRLQLETGVDISVDVGALAELRQKAEKAKQDLTQRQSVTITLPAQGQRFKTQITREEFSQAITSHIQGMLMTIEDVLDECKLSASDIDDVLLVGGSSRVPAVRDMLRDFFGREPNSSIHADEAVARGAALYAAKLLVEKDSETLLPAVREQAKALPSVQDVAPHSLGVTTVDDDDNEQNSIMLQRGTALPASIQDRFVTKDDGQTAVKVDVNEGESGDIDFVRQLGAFTLTLPEPRPAGSPIDVSIALDLSSIIRVVAVDVLSGNQKRIEIAYSSESG